MLVEVLLVRRFGGPVVGSDALKNVLHDDLVFLFELLLPWILEWLLVQRVANGLFLSFLHGCAVAPIGAWLGVPVRIHDI